MNCSPLGCHDCGAYHNEKWFPSVTPSCYRTVHLFGEVINGGVNASTCGLTDRWIFEPKEKAKVEVE